jgi:hypothetical protein
VSDWTALRDDAEAQGCEREFQDALDCQASNAMCWTEEDTATTTTTYGLLDDSACTSEFDSYAACYTEE